MREFPDYVSAQSTHCQFFIGGNCREGEINTASIEIAGAHHYTFIPPADILQDESNTAKGLFDHPEGTGTPRRQWYSLYREAGTAGNRTGT